MIKTLKSELRLRPTYDELIGMIEAQGDPNRPPIEQVIDRRATLFRNNQFGSQFDNVDFLGLKKQEEDKIKNELRQTQLRQTAVETGTSMGVVNYRMGTGETPPLSYGGRTPRGAYNADGFDTPTNDVNMSDEQIMRIKAEMEAFNKRRQEAQQASSSSARVDLDEAHRQSLPVGVMDNDEFEDMPPLINIEEGEEEEEFEDDPELIPADEDETTRPPPISRKHKETIDYNENIDRWKNKDVSADDILYQLHLRGIQLTAEQEEEMANLKTKGKGKTITKKDYLVNYVERLIQTGKWTDEINDQLLKSRMEEWRNMKKGKGKGVIRKAFESAGSALLDAGKEVAKDALIAGAQSAVMSLL